MSKCHYIYDNEVGKVLIPECWTVVLSGDIRDCTCSAGEDLTFAQFERESYNRELEKPIADKELAHLSGDYFISYLNDMEIVQRFAMMNRKTMASIIIKEMGFQEESRFETIHNRLKKNISSLTERS